MNKMLLLGCGCLLSVFASLAEVLVVPDDYPSIQEAITASVPGDTVLVKEGTYNELINYMGKDIVVGSLFLTTGDSSYIEQTIISAPSQGSVVTFANGDTQVNITDYSGTAPDMGAYEHIESVSSDPLPSYQLNIEFDILPGNSADERVICFSLPETRPVRLTICDLRGREVSCLASNTFPAGDRQVRMIIAGLPNGLYIVRLIAGKHSSSRKILVC